MEPAPAVARAAGLALGFAADALFADPARGHPVAAFGRAAARLERRVWRDSRAAGAVFAATCVVGAGAIGWAFCTALGGRTLATAVATWAVLGGASLVGEGDVMAGLLRTRRPAAGPDPARAPVRARRDRARRRRAGPGDRRVARREHLRRRRRAAALGRGRRRARAARLPRGEHPRRDGRLPQRRATSASAGPSARLDDVANLVPARVTAALDGRRSRRSSAARPARPLRIVRRDGRRHPSPNAGLCEAGVRRRARRAARRGQPVRRDGRGPARTRATGRRRRSPTSTGRPGCRGPSASRRPRLAVADRVAGAVGGAR